MTSKERVLTAMRGGIPDRVPCMPDFSNMIPCRLSGGPFWNIYLKGGRALYAAYCKAAKYYGIDGWYQTGSAVSFTREGGATSVRTRRENTPEGRIVVHTDIDVDGGTLSQARTYYMADTPTMTEKPIKDIKRDFPLFKKLLGRITGYDASLVEEQRAMCGDDGVFCLSVGYPGIQSFAGSMHGGAPEAIFACCDEPEIMDEWAALEERDWLCMTEIMLDQKPDALLLGGSGTLTLANPELVRRYALPTIKKITHMCRQAGIPSMLHSCGRSMAFLKMLYEETELDCINPLEAPPMGDVDLAEVKRLYGDKLCLMGNLNTTEMLLNTPEQVELAARAAIDAAGKGGGFILSSGDQLGRDTPDANIFKMVETAKTYGRY